jgi:hypothetical protein
MLGLVRAVRGVGQVRVAARAATARRRRQRAGAAIVLSALFAAAPAGAYRPFDETDAGVSEYREVELELGPVSYLHGSGGDAYAPGLIFNYGFAPRFEAVIDAHDALLFGGPDLAARRRRLETGVLVKGVLREGVLQGGSGPSVAVEAGALLPSVPVAGGVGAALTGIVSERWSNLAVHVDAEGDVTREGELAFIGGTILEGPDRWAVRPVTELLTIRQTAGGPTYSALLGAIWRAGERLTPDIAVRLADEAGARVIEVRAGVTWSFETAR